MEHGAESIGHGVWHRSMMGERRSKKLRVASYGMRISGFGQKAQRAQDLGLKAQRKTDCWTLGTRCSILASGFCAPTKATGYGKVLSIIDPAEGKPQTTHNMQPTTNKSHSVLRPYRNQI